MAQTPKSAHFGSVFKLKGRTVVTKGGAESAAVKLEKILILLNGIKARATEQLRGQ